MLNRTPARRSSRTIRAVTALCALVLVTSNALAAMGLCIAKAPAAPLGIAAVSGEPSCVQHVGQHAADDPADPPAEPAAAAHCPQDDPGAQFRPGDLPSLDLATTPLPLRAPAFHVDLFQVGDAHNDDLPPTQLYTRLSRLLL
jgi:hypothetical protein